ncbi:MAG: CDP-diacylglycerol--serine O-phosphatidyltransferase [Acidobacteriota bacterium]|nr:MAG: CDP-diacylglycerol--serine O-phosphatidyltransferase [Acidobacteriota bacterium]
MRERRRSRRHRQPRRFRRRLQGVAGWLPGALTLGNLLAGYAAILMASEGRFLVSCVLIFIAAALDGLDGRVARLTGTTSSFGGELDSLCDAVSFAVAPSLLAFHMGLGQLGRVGWAVCFLFAACGVIRLARFNAAPPAGGDFIGVPIPTAAAVASVPALLTGGAPIPPLYLPLHACVVLTTALLMVSRVRYPAFKQLQFGPKPYRVLALWAAILAGFLAFWEWMVPALILGYLLTPVARWLRDRPWRSRTAAAAPLARSGADDSPGREPDRDASRTSSRESDLDAQRGTVPLSSAERRSGAG